MTELNAAAVAKMIDHTILKTDATPADIAALADEAAAIGTYSICISPNMIASVPDLKERLGEVKLATVCGFPSGKHTAAMKAAEARESVAHGADEVDMVIDTGLLKAGNVEALTAEIAAVKAEVPAPHLLKVIIESATLTDDEIVAACKASEASGADYVKTSTGFHAAGGASVHAVELMAQTVGGRLGVKASGGIRDWAGAAAMIEAGATRLGVSATKAILDGSPQA